MIRAAPRPSPPRGSLRLSTSSLGSDQGSQFTSQAWTAELEGLGIRVSMDGKGRWMDNVFIERLWRSVKHEDIYLRGYGDLRELRQGLARWFERYNTWRPHQALGNQTPLQVHQAGRSGCPLEGAKLAA